MDSDGQAEKESYQDNPPVGVPTVFGFVPLGHRPDHDSCEEGGHRVDLTFDRGEPECVGEAIRQRSHGPAAEDGNGIGQGIFIRRSVRFFLCRDQPLDEEHDGQVEEENRQGRADGAHRVDHHSGLCGRGEHREEPGDDLEYRVSRGMADFKLVRRRDELATIPERRCRLDCGEICERGDQEHCRRGQKIPLFEFLAVHKFIRHNPDKDTKGMPIFAKISA